MFKGVVRTKLGNEGKESGKLGKWGEVVSGRLTRPAVSEAGSAKYRRRPRGRATFIAPGSPESQVLGRAVRGPSVRGARRAAEERRLTAMAMAGTTALSNWSMSTS